MKTASYESNKSVSQLIHSDGYEYAKYVLEARAIPSVIDGFKPVQRKIVFCANLNAKTEFRKIAALAADLASDAHYVHGEASAAAATSLMGSTWANNVSLIEGKGNFGSRLVPIPAASRYIFGKLSPVFQAAFKDTNLAPGSIDPDNPEPQYYLPLIPWLLVNGSKGIAVGFACEIQSRNPLNLIAACKDVLANKICPDISPWFWNFKGIIEKDEQEGYRCWGNYEIGKRNRVLITELPINYSRESYVEVLIRMEEEGKILSFEDNCSSKGFQFEVTMNPAQRAKAEKIGYWAYFKIVKNLPENINVIDTNNKLKSYKRAEDLLTDFVGIRLKFFQSRINYKLNELTKDLEFTNDLILFINSIAQGKIALQENGRLRKVDDIIASAQANYIKFGKDHIKNRIESLSEDRIAELKIKSSWLMDEIKYYKSITPQELYVKDLDALKVTITKYLSEQSK